MLKRSLRLSATIAVLIVALFAYNARRASADASHKGSFTGSTQFCEFTLIFGGGTTNIDLGGIGSDVDTYLFLYDGNNTYIDENDDGGPGHASHLTENLAPGTYIIDAETYDYENGDPVDSSGLGGFALNVSGLVNSLTLTSGSSDCNTPPAGPVTFFNPADGRVDGKPGDRIVVWCNANPQELVVYGVSAPGSKGFFLGKFANADLLNAGKAGITRNAGLGNGTISAMQDGHGNFYVAWNGGNFGANGQGNFAKWFSCFQ